jgi:carbonic anhydrase/acetyltransferase-like protein (isoleucine patch superfamily)
MPLYALEDLVPTLGNGAWAAPSADLIGDVIAPPKERDQAW